MAPSLTIYQGWVAKSALCVETPWINRKLSQYVWIDGATIRAQLPFILEKPAAAPSATVCTRVCK